MRRFAVTGGADAALGLIAAPAAAANGVLIVQKVTTGSTDHDTNQSQIEPTRMRAEIVSVRRTQADGRVRRRSPGACG